MAADRGESLRAQRIHAADADRQRLVQRREGPSPRVGARAPAVDEGSAGFSLSPYSMLFITSSTDGSLTRCPWGAETQPNLARLEHDPGPIIIGLRAARAR